MSAAVEALRAELNVLRDRLANLQRDEAACRSTVDDLERQLDAQRRRRETLVKQVQTDLKAIEAVEAALTVLEERLPAESGPPVVTPTPSPHVPDPTSERRSRLPEHPSAAKILREAEELDAGGLSQRTRERAEMVRRGLAEAQNGRASQAELVAFVFAAGAPSMSEAKARTAVEVGLTVLVADGRARCVNSVSEVWELTPPERASANIGVMIAGFRGRTTNWPRPDTTPASGTRIVLEEGSYEGSKKR